MYLHLKFFLWRNPYMQARRGSLSSIVGATESFGVSLFRAADYSEPAPEVERRIWSLQYYSPQRTYIAGYGCQRFTSNATGLLNSSFVTVSVRIVNTTYLSGFKYLFHKKKTKGHTEIKFTYWKENLKYFCSMREKWCDSNDAHWERICWHNVQRLNLRKRTKFAHGGVLRNFFRKPSWTLVTHFAEWNLRAQNTFSEPTHCHVNSCTPSGRHWKYVTYPAYHKQKVLKANKSYIFLILFNNTVSAALFGYSKLHTMASLVNHLPLLLWLNNGSNYGNH
jgi:hypothetical protein